jgi:cell filamentation protein
MYDAVEDSYCYPGTAVLINKLGLRDQAALSEFELEISNQRATEPLPTGLFSPSHYLAIHKHLFQDVYDWAGKVRTVRISKGGNPFCFPENIEGEMKSLFGDLAEARHFQGLSANDFAKKAAHFLAELNAIHPFREGNGRTQLTFLTLLADRAGHPLHMEKLDEKAVFEAIVESFRGEEAALQSVIAGLV